MEIAGASIQYSHRKAKSRNQILQVLDNRINRLEKQLCNEADQNTRDYIKKDLENSKIDYQTKMNEKNKKRYVQVSHKMV